MGGANDTLADVAAASERTSREAHRDRPAAALTTTAPEVRKSTSLGKKGLPSCAVGEGGGRRQGEASIRWLRWTTEPQREH